MRVETSKRVMLVNSTSSVLANLINISVLVWLQQYLLKKSSISDAEYALYAILMSLMIFLPLLSTLMTGGLGRYVVEAYARHDDDRVTEIVSTLMPPLLGVCTAILAIGSLVIWHIDWILTDDPGLIADARWMLALLMASAVLHLQLTPLTVGLYVRQKFVTISLLNLLTQLLRVSLLFALLFGVGSRMLWVVVATVAARLFVLMITVALSRRAVPALRFDRRKVNYRSIGAVASYNTWNFFGHLSGQLQIAADPWLLHVFGTPNDVACLYVAHLAYDRLDSSSIVATQAVQPTLTALHATGEKRRLGNAFLRGSRYGLWIICLFAVPVMIYQRDLILLYLGEDYINAGTCMLLIFGQFPLYYSTLLLPRIAEATAKVRRMTIIGVSINALNIAMSFTLIRYLHFGAPGAALARLLAAIVALPFLVPLALRLAGVSFGQWVRVTVIRGLMPAVVAAAVWLALELLVRPTNWITLGACTAAGAAVYLGVLLGFCLEPGEREDLRRLLTRLGVVAETPEPEVAE
ncbi:MAG: hypothetical protein D6744_01075 [Planctomycetota bacterium]|nr:MAG: hypothetical protein D6744_01075 [Planctomycetota bacterium]